MTGSWKLVPVEASHSMWSAPLEGYETVSQGYDDAVWDAYVSNAPTPPDEVLERMARAFVETWQPKLGLMDEEMHDAVKAMRAALSSLTVTGSGE